MKNISIIIILSCFLINYTPSIAQSKISAISARLFYNQDKEDDGFGTKKVSGELSEDIIGKGDLFNTIIGEGFAEGYSHQTLVIVRIASRDKSNKDQIIKLSVTANGKVVFQLQKTFSVIGNDAIYQMPFLLYDTGCDQLKVKAEIIVGGKSISVMSKTIDFVCGE